MQIRREYLGAAAASILVLLLVWFIGPIFHLTGANAMVLRGGILLLGIICIVGLLLWASSKRPSQSAPEQNTRVNAASGRTSEDADILLREAAHKVAAARLATGTKLSSLPVVFLLGESGSGKTTTIDRCGLDAELLAGQVYQEGAIVPTRLMNLWFTRKTIFVEVGGPLLEDNGACARIAKYFVPGRFRSILSQRLAPRAAVVCVDCETLVREPGIDKIAAQARRVRTSLEELSHHTGVSLPVYVLFNRSDRIPFFEDFSGSFSNEETAQVLGTTLPLATATGSGVYAEQETRRLTTAFQALVFSLADCRLGLLSRERSSNRQGGIYEFPREFGKLSKPLVQFLVELCRPCQLRSAPFLRGFYFVGQRLVPVSTGSSTVVEATNVRQRTPGGFSANATSMMNAQDFAARTGWASSTQLQGAGEGRNFVQHVFLSHIFSHIVLQDRPALGVSVASTRGEFGPRILLGMVAALATLWIIVLAASFVENSRLVSSVHQAAEDVAKMENSSAPLPAIGSLQHLDALRKVLVQLREYRQNGAPVHLRWGLFAGDTIFNDALTIYFRSFEPVPFSAHEPKSFDRFAELPRRPASLKRFRIRL